MDGIFFGLVFTVVVYYVVVNLRTLFNFVLLNREQKRKKERRRSRRRRRRRRRRMRSAGAGASARATTSASASSSRRRNHYYYQQHRCWCCRRRLRRHHHHHHHHSRGTKQRVPATTAMEKSASGNEEGYAWRGDPIRTKSLPLLPNGKVDYSSIDASPISKVLTSTIRKLLVAEVGKDTDPREHTNFEALMTSVREVNDMKGTAKDVQTRAKRVFKGILPALYIGWIPPLWKKFVDPNAPKWVTGFSFHLVFIVLFPWLMGPMEGVEHEDVEVPEKLRKTFPFLPKVVSVPQAIKAERCRFLETSSCASVCVNSCKVPSQEWLKDDFGMDLHIQPNYDDFSCVWSFNKEPPPLEEDAAILVPCFTNCNSEFKGEKDALKQVMRMKQGVGVTEDGVDKYTGETLEAIAKRASELAIAEANANAVVADGTAVSEETFKGRIEKVREGGKCWSVDAERANLR